MILSSKERDKKIGIVKITETISINGIEKVIKNAIGTSTELKSLKKTYHLF